VSPLSLYLSGPVQIIAAQTENHEAIYLAPASSALALVKIKIAQRRENIDAVFSSDLSGSAVTVKKINAIAVRELDLLVWLPVVPWSDVLTCSVLWMFFHPFISSNLNGFDGDPYIGVCCLVIWAKKTSRLPADDQDCDAALD
jgi:hypothetical protein